jgi:excisionase family DNA binding protein
MEERMTEEEWFLSAQEVADWLGMSPRTIAAKAQHGEIVGQRFGRPWRFRRADVEAYIQQQGKPQERTKKG